MSVDGEIGITLGEFAVRSKSQNLKAFPAIDIVKMQELPGASPPGPPTRACSGPAGDLGGPQTPRLWP